MTFTQNMARGTPNRKDGAALATRIRAMAPSAPPNPTKKYMPIFLSLSFILLYLSIVLFFPCFLLANWAEETLSHMTLDEKIGQLFVAPACPLRGEDHWKDWV